MSARIQLFKQLKVKLILPNDFFVQRSGDKDQMFIENYVITRQIGANKLLLIALVIDRWSEWDGREKALPNAQEKATEMNQLQIFGFVRAWRWSCFA